MKISYKTGDLLECTEPLLVHGCNAKGAFASGVAGQIRRRMPFAYEAYRLAFEKPDSTPTLGDVIWACNIGGGCPLIVGNLIIQADYGRIATQQYVNYDAVASAFQRVNDQVRRVRDGAIAGLSSIEAVAMPLVGCGLGNGEWPIVASIIENEAIDFVPVVYLLDGIIP